MKHTVTLTITSLLSILLFSLHWADEVARGLEPGTVSAFGGLLILAVCFAQRWCSPSRRAENPNHRGGGGSRTRSAPKR
jgi:hypothetical protein